MNRRGCSSAGFTLLEVMVALGLLAMSLVIVVGISTSNVRATNHARSITLASFLARAKIAEVEDQVLTQGFVDNDEAEDGDFADEGHPQIRWTTLIEKIELPTDATQMAQQQTQDKVNNSNGNPMMAMAGLMGGFMTMLIEPIRVGLEESVRRLSVSVLWDEPGKPKQTFDVVTFMTDPAKLDLAVGAVGGGLGAAAGAAGAAGTPGAAGTGAIGGAAPGAGAATPAAAPKVGR